MGYPIRDEGADEITEWRFRAQTRVPHRRLTETSENISDRPFSGRSQRAIAKLPTVVNAATARRKRPKRCRISVQTTMFDERRLAEVNIQLANVLHVVADAF